MEIDNYQTGGEGILGLKELPGMGQMIRFPHPTSNSTKSRTRDQNCRGGSR